MKTKIDYTQYSKEELIAEIIELKNRKKYGLVWNEKREPEKVVLQCKKELPVLKEVKSKAIKNDPDKTTHILIKGDNYHALSVLNYTHPNAIDVIYIDPPYNTGARDWKYNNNFVDDSDTYRHSKWIGLMKNRLSLTKPLLKKDGVLIVAIDDNEVHRLRLLIEDIFPGHDTTSITIVQNPRGNITKNFARTHEYALFVIPKGLSVIERLVVPNTSPRKLRRWGHNSKRTDRPTMFYPIYVKGEAIVKVGDVPNDDFHPTSKNIECKNGEIEIWPIDQNGIERRWNFSLSTILGELNRIQSIERDNEIDLFLTKEYSVPKTVWNDSEFEAGRNGATLVRDMTGKNFPYPKSIYTVKRCLELILKNKPTAVVLDYFAGSGTTTHAVLLMNDEDNGNRSSIICTNNENNIIEDITYPRIKSAICGYNTVKGLGGNLKYFKTAFVPAKRTDQNKEKLTKQSVEMLCLKENTFQSVLDTDFIKIFKNNDHYTGILFDDQKISYFKKQIQNFDQPVNIYVFSLGDDDFSEEFIDLKCDVKICSIPIAILRVYKRIFR